MSCSKTKFLFLLSAVVLIVAFPSFSFTQGFLHTDGKRIVNGSGENVLLKGIGTGNWMIQEGYMMRSQNVAGTQHEFRSKLEESIGEKRTIAFYSSWLNNHFRKIDVDSMAAWGFNSVRVALHYKWFTLPIEEEPKQGENTWLSTGFDLTDSLLSWCASNQVYLILDLHGAPGGQGKNASISDYDDTKPSLWESELNKQKTVALWRKLAERYSDDKWIGGYDLINEVNWTFPEGNNSQLRELYGQITQAIRQVDKNHMIIIEGNWFANDFSGLTPPWDDNMIYSFHKYWSSNSSSSLNWVQSIRDEHNVPIWLGESGENSNTWFTNLIELCEKNNIGWSWWPVKKSGINNILRVKTNQDYLDVLDYWGGNGSLTDDQVHEAVMSFSENHAFENCYIQYDVIDALIRQPQSTETKPFKTHTTKGRIYAVDYDLGRNNFAYFDTDTADYHQDTEEYGTWNHGWNYRNDGVDIDDCNDAESNIGFAVGWTKKGEWLQYTINSAEEAAYKLELRLATRDIGFIHIEVDGKVASKKIELPDTGGWQDWESLYTENIIVPKGETKVRVFFDSDATNLNYLRFSTPKSAADIPFEILSATSDKINNQIYINLNKPISTPIEDIDVTNFQLIVNNALTAFSDLRIAGNNNHQIIVNCEQDLFFTDKIRISYKGDGVKSNSQALQQFSGAIVQNNLHPHFDIPTKIEAEDNFYNNGFQLENCTDIGAGKNTAYANDGDYLDYLLNIPTAGIYKCDFRVSTLSSTAEILIMNSVNDKITPIKSVKFNVTGGWQSWETQSTTVSLPAGKMVFRIYSRHGEHNLNWFSLDSNTSTLDIPSQEITGLYPNPATDSIRVNFQSNQKKNITLFSIEGKMLKRLSSSGTSTSIDIRDYPNGIYILKLSGKDFKESIKFQILR